MKGEITLSREEVQALALKHIQEMLNPSVRITSMGDYYGSLKVSFTDEPEEKEA